MKRIIRNLNKFSIFILLLIFISSIIGILTSYFILKNKNENIYIERNTKITEDYSKKFELYINYTSSYLQYAKGYAKKFNTFNSTLNDYINLSGLNNSEIFSAINNVRIHYNVSNDNRTRYEQRMSLVLDRNITFTDLQNNGSQIISPIRPWYCPTFFLTPITTFPIYRPGFDICDFATTKPSIDKLITSNSDKIIIEPRNGITFRAVVLDFFEKIPDGFVFLTIAIDNILKFIIKDTEKIQLFKNDILFYNSCINCINYSIITTFINLPNKEIIKMDVLFPNENNISQILFILLGIILIDLLIFIVVINFEVQKNRFIIVDRMLGYVNHEVRNPLNSINGLIEVCLIKLENQRNFYNESHKNDIHDKHSEMESNLYTAKRACDMLTHIVNDILDLKRIKDGKLVINKDYININDFVINLQKIILPKLNEVPGVEFIFQNPDNIIYIYFDEQRLLQILLNFLTNSLKFTEYGRITLVINKINKYTTQITVIDTGRGIPEKNFKNIFKPFEHNELNDSLRSGIGLGLYLCKMIIDQTGDKIGFTSDLGDGSSFFILIEDKKIV